jgi:hypothetical protein
VCGWEREKFLLSGFFNKIDEDVVVVDDDEDWWIKCWRW